MNMTLAAFLFYFSAIVGSLLRGLIVGDWLFCLFTFVLFAVLGTFCDIIAFTISKQWSVFAKYYLK